MVYIWASPWVVGLALYRCGALGMGAVDWDRYGSESFFTPTSDSVAQGHPDLFRRAHIPKNHLLC